MPYTFVYKLNDVSIKKKVINEIIYNIGEKEEDSSRIRIPICTLYKVNYVTFFVLSIRMGMCACRHGHI